MAAPSRAGRVLALVVFACVVGLWSSGSMLHSSQPDRRPIGPEFSRIRQPAFPRSEPRADPAGAWGETAGAGSERPQRTPVAEPHASPLTSMPAVPEPFAAHATSGSSYDVRGVARTEPARASDSGALIGTMQSSAVAASGAGVDLPPGQSSTVTAPDPPAQLAVGVIVFHSGRERRSDGFAESALRHAWLSRLPPGSVVFVQPPIEPPAGGSPGGICSRTESLHPFKLELQRRLACALVVGARQLVGKDAYLLLDASVHVWWRRLLEYAGGAFPRAARGRALVVAPGSPRSQLLALLATNTSKFKSLAHAAAQRLRAGAAGSAGAPGARNGSASGAAHAAAANVSLRASDVLALKAASHVDSYATLVSSATAAQLGEAELEACEATVALARAMRRAERHGLGEGNRTVHLLAFCAVARAGGQLGAEEDLFLRIPPGKTLKSFAEQYATHRPVCVPTHRPPALLAGLQPATELAAAHAKVVEEEEAAAAGGATAGASDSGGADAADADADDANDRASAAGARGAARASPLPRALGVSGELPASRCAPALLTPLHSTFAFNSSKRDSLMLMMQFSVLDNARVAWTDGARAWVQLPLRARARAVLYTRRVHIRLALQSSSISDIRGMFHSAGDFPAGTKQHMMGGASPTKQTGEATAIYAGSFRVLPGAPTQHVDVTEPLRAMLRGPRARRYPFFSVYVHVRCDTSSKELFAQPSANGEGGPRLFFAGIGELIAGTDGLDDKVPVVGAPRPLCGTLINRHPRLINVA